MCDTLVVVREDSVLFGKNSDRDPNEAQRLEWLPRRTYPADTPLRCTYITLPQVRNTHAVLISRPFWMWGAEMGANEHGLCIGNEAVWTTQPYAAQGLTGMDLLRLALERCCDARSAVSLIVELLTHHGQGGGCGYEDRSVTYHNSFLVADPREAFVLETAGRLYAVEQVERARSISNLLTIEPFASTHADRKRLEDNGAAARRACTQRGATLATGAGDIMTILRSHGPNHPWPRYESHNGAMSAPCMHAGGERAASQTTSSWVAELRPEGSQYWATGTAAPCTSVFLPVSLASPVDLGSPDGCADGESWWWRHEALHRRLLRDPETLAADFVAERDALQQAWLASPPSTDRAMQAATAFYARWAAKAQLLRDRRPDSIQSYWAERHRQAAWDG